MAPPTATQEDGKEKEKKKSRPGCNYPRVLKKRRREEKKKMEKKVEADAVVMSGVKEGKGEVEGKKVEKEKKKEADAMVVGQHEQKEENHSRAAVGY